MAHNKLGKQKNQAGTHGMKPPPGRSPKSAAQMEGQFSRDPKGRQGQYGGAGNPPLIKK